MGTGSKTTFEEDAKLVHKPLDKPHTICDTTPTGKRRTKRASDCQDTHRDSTLTIEEWKAEQNKQVSTNTNVLSIDLTGVLPDLL